VQSPGDGSSIAFCAGGGAKARFQKRADRRFGTEHFLSDKTDSFPGTWLRPGTPRRENEEVGCEMRFATTCGINEVAFLPCQLRGGSVVKSCSLNPAATPLRRRQGGQRVQDRNRRNMRGSGPSRRRRSEVGAAWCSDQKWNASHDWRHPQPIGYAGRGETKNESPRADSRNSRTPRVASAFPFQDCRFRNTTTHTDHPGLGGEFSPKAESRTSIRDITKATLELRKQQPPSLRKTQLIPATPKYVVNANGSPVGSRQWWPAPRSGQGKCRAG